MKKTILLSVMITGCTLLVNFNAVAQNASPETKSTKSTSKPPAPASQILQEQDAKPVVPGGEFKPRDTRTGLPAAKTKEYDEPKPVVPNKPSATNATAPVTSEVKRSTPVAAPQNN